MGNMVRNELLDKRLVPLLALAAAPLVAGCGDGTATAAPVVERTDSAGVEVVMSRGSDLPLDWRFEEVLRLGGTDDGPEAFYEIGGNVRTDAAGNIYVLDGGNHRVVVFAREGRHLRSFGGRGGGPGEFQFVTAFGVERDGTVRLFDVSRRGFVVWDASGSVLSSEPFEGGSFVAGHLPRVNGHLVAMVPASDPAEGMRATDLVVLDEERAVLARHETPVGAMAQFDGCPVRFPAEPLLLPQLLWDATQEGVAVNDGAAYAIRLLDLGGTVRRIVRRDLPIRHATVDDAAAELPEGFRLTYPGGECRISTEEVVRQHGYADYVPAIRAVRAAPDGTLWVNRARGADATKIDILSADGAYLGTLPPDAPFPAAFTPEGNPITVERDDFDLPYVVVYRLHRA